MAQFVESMEWGPPMLPEVRNLELEAAVKKATGSVPTMFKYVASCEWLARAFISAHATAPSHARMDDLMFAMAVASQENSCRYCYGAQRSALRLLGIPEHQIVQMEADLQLAEFSEPRRTLASFARQLAKSNPRPARAEFEALMAVGFTRGACIEIAYGVGDACFGNRIATFVAAPPESELEAMPDSLMGRLLRPFIARKIRGKPSLPPPPLGNFDFPFGSIISALDGTHAAAAARNMLTGAFESTSLPRRARSLVFAVVAHTIGCARTEAESRRLLAEEGIDAATADDILTHLASPKLDPLEAALVTYARDTVRYRPLAIQTRTRALAEQIGPAAAVDTIATTALANQVVRIAMLGEC